MKLSIVSVATLLTGALAAPAPAAEAAPVPQFNFGWECELPGPTPTEWGCWDSKGKLVIKPQCCINWNAPGGPGNPGTPNLNWANECVYGCNEGKTRMNNFCNTNPLKGVKAEKDRCLKVSSEISKGGKVPENPAVTWGQVRCWDYCKAHWGA